LSVGRQANGDVTVTGPGSLLQLVGSGYIGKAGDGNLVVENEAIVTIGMDSTGASGLNVGGGGLNTSDQLWVGGAGTALVTQDSTLFAAGNINVGVDGASGDLIINNVVSSIRPIGWRSAIARRLRPARQSLLLPVRLWRQQRHWKPATGRWKLALAGR
jgi:T5SS/PEP-CTERM-associated repeat protein